MTATGRGNDSPIGASEPGRANCEQGTRTGLLGEAAALGRELAAHAPRRCALALMLLLAAGVTETFGIVMIVPLLHVAGLAGPAGASGPIVEAMAGAAERLGIGLTLPTVLAVFVALATVRAVVSWWREVLLAGIRLEFVDRIREDLYGAIAGAKWEALNARRRSDFQHVLTSDVGRIGNGAFILLQLAVVAVLALAQLALAVLISPAFSVAAVLTGGALVWLCRPLVRRSRDLGERLTRSSRGLHASVTDFLGGLKLAKSHNAEHRHVAHFTDTIARMRRRQMAFTRLSAAARAGLDTGAALALAGLVWLAVATAALAPAELLLMAVIFARVTPALFRAQQHAQQLAHVLPAWANTRAIRDSLAEAAEERAGEAAPPMALRRSITLGGVSFAHAPASGRRVLADVDLTIPAHSMVAIAGPSGAGKSTLADLLLGLTEPCAGEVRVDGTPLAGAALRRWRRSVAYVPQEPYLLHDTIRANLAWACPRATESEMWQALGLAAAREFVARLPQGLDTVVGDRGDRLSGGERQRITLARALLREPALLVLDEATSQFDAGNERHVRAALEGLRDRMTLVVIAHRGGLLAAADRIVVLDGGRVVANGRRSEVAPALASIGMDWYDGSP